MKRMLLLFPAIILLSGLFSGTAFSQKKPIPNISDALSGGNNEEIIRKIEEAASLGADINTRDPFGNSLLMKMLQSKYYESIAVYLIQKGARLDTANDTGYTAAHLAASNKCVHALFCIARKGGPITRVNKAGEKPLDCFLRNGDSPTRMHWLAVIGDVRSFTEKDRSYLTARDARKKLPIDYAADAGNLAAFSFLYKAGGGNDADYSARKDWLNGFYQADEIRGVEFILDRDPKMKQYEMPNLLADAIEKGNRQMIGLFIRKGVSLDGYYMWETSALCYARDVGMAEYLLKHGASLNGYSVGNSPLRSAVLRDNLKLLQFYVEKGADLSIGGFGEPLIITAVRRNNIGILRYLVDHGVPVENCRGEGLDFEKERVTPLTAAVEGDSSEVLEFLWERKIDRESARPALINAVKKRSLNSYRFLSGKGVRYVRETNGEDEPLLSIFAGETSFFSKDVPAELLRVLVADGYDPEERNNAGETPLHIAAMKGNALLCELFLDAGVDINARDNRGDTPLHKLAGSGRGNEQLIEMMIARGAKLDIRDNDGYTPYDRALKSLDGAALKVFARHGFEMNDDIMKDVQIRRLIDEGDFESSADSIVKTKDPDMRNREGDTVLNLVARSYRGNTNASLLMKKLIEAGADVNARDRNGMSVLRNAFSSGDILRVAVVVSEKYGVDIPAGKEAETIAELVKKGTIGMTELWPYDLNRPYPTSDDSLLVDAMSSNNLPFTKLLILLGADPDRKNHEGVTPLMSALLFRIQRDAITVKDMSVLTFVIDHGADVNVRNNDGITALSYAAVAGNLPAVKLLLDRGARINDRDNDGWSALMHACENGRDDVALELVTRGADIRIKGKEGLDANTLCAVRGEKKTARELGKRGAIKPDKTVADRYRLFRAIKFHKTTDALKIVEKLRTVDFTDKYGMTPLMWAIETQEREVARLCMKKGADVNRRCALGTTPLMFAVRRYDSMSVKYLVARGADMNAARKDGGTALGDAFKLYKAMNMIGILCSAKADRNARFADGTPILFNYLNYMGAADPYDLKKQGFDLNIRDRSGRTMLMIAVFGKKYEHARDLVSNGVDVSLKDNKGRTALDYASAAADPDCVRILHRAGAAPTAQSCAVMGDFFREDRRYATAVVWYERALSMDPSINARNGYGISLVRVGRLGDAEKAFAGAVADHPDDPMPYYNLCCLFAKKGDRDTAFMWLDRAIGKGLTDRAFMKHDADLSPLRDDPRYKSIMAAKRLPVQK